MANAYVPGGTYNLGGSGQEENMFRRTNCHFTINRNKQLEEYIPKESKSKSKYWKYKDAETNLLTGETGYVYLDKANPCICIKGAETESNELTNVDLNLGYTDLKDDEIFFFYEVRCAPLDRRDPLPPNRDMKEDTEKIKKRISALFETLKQANIKHVILGDFGCGTLKNNPFTIANIYKEVISTYLTHFEVIKIAIPYTTYNKPIYEAFHKVFTANKIRTGVVIDKITPLAEHTAKAEEIAEEFLMLARDRINELRNILEFRSDAKVTIAGGQGKQTHNLASDSVIPLWKATYTEDNIITTRAVIKFRTELQTLFAGLQKDYTGRVSYGDITATPPSLDHYLVWSAFTDNYESTPTRVENSEPLIVNSQAIALSPHKIGLFGIIAAPGDIPK